MVVFFTKYHFSLASIFTMNTLLTHICLLHQRERKKSMWQGFSTTQTTLHSIMEFIHLIFLHSHMGWDSAQLFLHLFFGSNTHTHTFIWVPKNHISFLFSLWCSWPISGLKHFPISSWAFLATPEIYPGSFQSRKNIILLSSVPIHPLGYKYHIHIPPK